MAVGRSDQSWQTVAVVVLTAVGDSRHRPAQTDADGCIRLERRRRLCQTQEPAVAAVGDRHRRLHQIREVATAASDSRGSGSGRSIGSELADGGSGDDDGRRRQRDRHRPMQTVASDSRDSGSCVRLERRRRSVGRSDQSRQTAAVTVTMADGDK